MINWTVHRERLELRVLSFSGQKFVVTYPSW